MALKEHLGIDDVSCDHVVSLSIIQCRHVLDFVTVLMLWIAIDTIAILEAESCCITRPHRHCMIIA